MTRPPGLTSFDLTGRTALVTGSSRGIGRALAQGLAAAGAEVVVHGRSLDAARTAAREISASTGVTTHVARFDVTDSAAVNAGVSDLEMRLGRAVDILVNNAGLQRRAPITEFTDADWHDLIATNLTGTFYMARRIATSMIAQGAGRIINIGSVQSLLARPNIAPYSATKGAIVMLTKGLCADLGPHGIAVNAIAPGYIETDLTAPLVLDETFSAWVRQRTPAARWGTPADLVGAAVFLASDASAFMQGQTLFVDGGMTAVL